MNRSLCAISLYIILPFILGSCGMVGKWFRPKPKPVKTPPHDLFIGTIESVNPEQHFVLIHTVMRTTLITGSKLETRPVNGSKAKLTITPEQKLNFLAADITEGFPQPGDPVVYPPQLPADAAPGGTGQPTQLPLQGGTLPPPIY